jgi:hypothetical protein
MTTTDWQRRAAVWLAVVSRYAPLSQHEDYDWAIVPFEAYLHGLESPDLAPLVATPSLHQAIQQYGFDRLFSSALRVTTEGELPDGQWRATLANRFGRSLYVFAVQTTAEDDAAIVATFNGAANKSRFNFFYGNCSNQTKAIFDIVMPGIVGDRVSGITMETPKGLVKALVAHAKAHPALQLRVRRFPKVAALILAAAIDHHLHQPPMRRADIGEVDTLLRLLNDTAVRAERVASSGVVLALPL